MTKKRLFLLLTGIVFIISFSGASGLNAALLQKTDKEREGLLGSVKTVLVEIGKMSKNQAGKWIPGPRMPWLSTTYDPQGNRIEEDQLYNEESLNFKSVFVHDSSGRLKEGVETDYKGTVVFTWDYTHETALKITEKRVFPNEVLFSTSVYLYDANGNLLEETRSHTQTANDFKWVYRYDELGRMLEESFYLIRSKPLPNQTGKALNYRSVYSYDKEGHPAEKIHYGATGDMESKKSYRYKYDSEGNWVTQTAWESANSDDKTVLEPTEVTYRTITYYPSK